MVKAMNSTKTRARKVELLISLFIAKHNLALSLSEPLTNFLRKIDIDSEVQKELSCSTTKCTSIICKVTGQYCFQKLVAVLQTQKFSLLIDESTDLSTSKNLALTVQYRRKDHMTHDQFLALLQVSNK